MIKTKAITFTILTLTITSTLALDTNTNTKHRFCVGEHGSSCPEQPHYGCPQDTHIGSDQIGALICTVNTAQGKKVLDNQVILISSKDGNKCGYTIFEVTCFGTP